MTKAKVFVIAAALALALGGCSKGKKAKCEKGWDQMKDLMSAFAEGMGGDKVKKEEMEKEMDKAKAEFLTECEKLPDDAVDCIADLSKAMTDPECQKKLKDSPMGMGMGKKKHSSDDMKMDEPKKDEPKDDKKDEAK
jgi:hypothetical protein